MILVLTNVADAATARRIAQALVAERLATLRDGKDGVDGKDGRDGAPGERGPPGPPGKLPAIRAWGDAVHYAGDVVTHGGSVYQAQRDTGREPPVQRLRPEHGLLGTLLQRLAQRFGGAIAQAPQARFDDAAWVGFRLAELLPFSNPERQALLQCEDVDARLDRIVQRLPQLQDH